MSSCAIKSSGVFSGLSGAMSIPGTPVKIAIIKQGNTFTDAEFISSAKWRTLLAGETAGMQAIILSFLRGLEDTTPEATKETSVMGLTEIIRYGMPAMTAYLDVNRCDYEAMLAFNANIVDIVIFYDNGKMSGSRNLSLSTKGYKAKIEFDRTLKFSDTDKQKSFPIYISFLELSEFDDGWYDTPDADFSTFIPTGLSLVNTSVLAATADLKVTNRNTGLGYEGLLYTDAEIIDHSLSISDLAVTVLVDNDNGSYTATVVKDASGTPAELAADEWVDIQLKHGDGTYYDYVSNVVRLKHG